MPRSAPAPDAALEGLLDGEGIDVALGVAKVVAFETLLLRWNPRAGLVSKRDAERLRERHVLDSLTLLPWWEGELADVGPGGGFPGLPLAIARPERRVTLIERSVRKARFLRQAIVELALPNVELVVADAAAFAPAASSPPASFDTVTARAVAKPAAAWRLARRLLTGGGRLLIQSREPVADEAFDGGAIRGAEQVASGWITAVGAR